MLLRAYGYEVASADSGMTALALLRGGYRPCLALLDNVMPDLSGRDLHALLLGDPVLAAIPVVFWSGANEVVDAHHKGVAGMLAKPIDPDELLRVIDQYARCAD
jgi:two-component system, sensor histidine kinase and response regulator